MAGRGWPLTAAPPDGTWQEGRVQEKNPVSCRRAKRSRQDSTFYRKSRIPGRMGYVGARMLDQTHPGVGYSYKWKPTECPGLMPSSESRYSVLTPGTAGSGKGVVLSLGLSRARKHHEKTHKSIGARECNRWGPSKFQERIAV